MKLIDDAADRAKNLTRHAALVSSLEFNPGHFSFLTANYKLLAACGYRPHLYLNRKYNEMDTTGELRKINEPHGLNDIGQVAVAVFWFPSLRNIFEIGRLKLIHNAYVTYIYHEPFDSIKSYYQSGFGFLKIVKICLINLANLPVLRLSDSVVLPSRRALNLYKQKYLGINKNHHYMPLLFDDEATSSSLGVSNKKFISYIGTIAADHAFNRFVQFVNSAIRHDWFPNHSFFIGTKSRIPREMRDFLRVHECSGRIIVRSGRPMSNDEINGYFRDSIAVWNAYNRSMQSAVLPKAYMFGTPVIGLKGTTDEFIEDHSTGVLIDDNSDFLQIKAAIEDIVKNQQHFLDNCRKKFLDTFFYANKVPDFLSIISRLPPTP